MSRKPLKKEFEKEFREKLTDIDFEGRIAYGKEVLLPVFRRKCHHA